MKKNLFPTVAAALVATLGTPAWSGSVSLDTSLSNITFTLVDLDLNDGITPGFTTVPNPTTGLSQINALVLAPDHTPVYGWKQGMSFDDTLLSQQTIPSGSALTFFGHDGANGLTADMHLQLQDSPGTTQSYGAVQLSSLPWPDANNLLLTPNTQLVLSADFRVHMVADFDPAQDAANGEAHRVKAYTTVLLSDPGAWSTGGGQYDAFVHQMDNFSHGVVAMDESFSQHVAVSYVNASATTAKVYMQIGMWNQSVITMVPEPSTLALSLLGALALVPAVARRRRAA